MKSPIFRFSAAGNSGPVISGFRVFHPGQIRPAQVLHAPLSRVLKLVLSAILIVAISGGAWGQDDPPEPSKDSVIGDTVVNTLTGETTTVSELIVDPEGTDTAGETAFVRTADGYIFLVKEPGEKVYEIGEPPQTYVVVDSGDAESVFLETDPPGGDTLELNIISRYQPEGETGTTPTYEGPSRGGVTYVRYGRNGDSGRTGALFVPPSDGKNGAAGPTVNYSNSENISTDNQVGLLVGSVGGNGGRGGNSWFSFWSAGDGGAGGNGGPVTVTNNEGIFVETTGAEKHGIYAFSIAGKGGAGGDGNAAPSGGTGGASRAGGPVTVTNDGTIVTHGDNAFGIYGLSRSSSGGSGGDQWGLIGGSGDGAKGGNGGTVSITNSITGSIWTEGVLAHGILAQSVGGVGGDSGSSGNLILSLGTSGDDGGSGGPVYVTNAGSITTTGNFSRGIFAQSLGGGGGSGGDAGGLFAIGGAGAGGGSSSPVTVTNASTGTITTGNFPNGDLPTGVGSDGIMAQSVGGSGGSGGSSGGLVAIGGNGAHGGDGNEVTVSNLGAITTHGDFARGIVAQSIGGGGGDGGSTGAMIASIGGSAGPGGDGGEVTVTNGGEIRTYGNDAMGVLAQSIGGGGGNGGSAVSVSAFAGVAIGGSGGDGGQGGDVNIALEGKESGGASVINTTGDRSIGIHAQSVGGGGGNGGGAVQVSLGFMGAASIAIGGDAGEGGDGGDVTLSRGAGTSIVETGGDYATGVFLESVGGGGGNGGYSVAVAASAGPASGSLSVSVGGSGGKGGDGGLVSAGQIGVDENGFATLEESGFAGSILTKGDNAAGLIAQSVGGGGGNGGLAVSVAASAGAAASGSLAVSVGGDGGEGGLGGEVVLGIEGDITTEGNNSTALLAQSVGGGGGNGGGSIAGSVAASGGASGAVSVALGGAAGDGGEGGDVKVATGPGQITTEGDHSTAILVQSVGGGGGNGGYSVAASLGAAATAGAGVSVGIGGEGGGGGDAGDVWADIQSDVTTSSKLLSETSVETGADGETFVVAEHYGENASGIVVQSIGGGGGNGGFNVSAAAGAGGTVGGAIGVGLGGSGGMGGRGGDVFASSSGTIITGGQSSTGFLAQSIGGGGGNGGFNVSAGVAGAGTASGAINVGLGGGGGDGNTAGDVHARVAGHVQTAGDNSTGVIAQSIGGGGGNGGFNVSAGGAGAGTAAGAVSVGLGGSAGKGGHAGTVELSVTNSVVTSGDNATAIVAQSIGGGGGNGGFNVSAGLAGAGTGSGTVNVGLGGDGGSGGNAGGILYDSNGNVVVDENGKVVYAKPGVDVDVSGEGIVWTSGDHSVGILAQSVGGGGGNGGFNISAGGAGSKTGSGAVSVGLGGDGESGGLGSSVNLFVEKDVTTQGDHASAIIAQSVGGGGGNGGFNVSAALSGAMTGSGSVSVGLGGSGAGGGDAGSVNSVVNADLTTQGQHSTGLLVQSVGGGGGNGGFNVSAALSAAKTASGSVGVGIGGSGGDGGDGGDVSSEFDGTVITSSVLIPESVDPETGELIPAHYANNASGIIVQSLGGGGGNGGINVTAPISFAKDYTGSIGVGVGGSGGGGGNAGAVSNDVTGYVQTRGDESIAVLAQSLGGGGGNGGLNVTGSITGAKKGSGSIAVGVGGFGGDGGDGSTVNNIFTGGILTTGDNSNGIVAQSLGGGGGNGGINVTGTINFSQENGASVGVGIGGFGGNGGNAANVTSTVTAGDEDDAFVTQGDNSSAIVAQSIGGSGGNGGINVTGSVNLTGKSGAAVGVGIGGFGGGAGHAGSVVLDVEGPVLTMGNDSHGLVAQSIGGGGGNGGTNVSGTLAFTGSKSSSSKTAAVSVGVGGFGGGGGNAGSVDLDYSGSIDTRPKVWVPETIDPDTGETIPGHYELIEGVGSHGILAQSVGGGGGNGGVNVSAGLSFAKSGEDDGGDAYGIMVGVGGFGGEGGDAGDVDVTVTGEGSIATYGIGRSAILAQSLGGGGGNGGLNVSAGISSDSPLIVGVGGFGGDAGLGKDVTVDVTADVYASGLGTELNFGAGILAQSIGGGGGNGAVNVSGGLVIDKESSLPSVTVGVGGFGGDGAASGDVTVNHVGEAIASGDWIHGVMAQSIGGGGGNGGMNVSGQLNFADSENSGGKKDLSIVAGIGGNGGAGANAGNVVISQSGNVVTQGDNARGVVGQSIGGGGGIGGMNVTAVFTKQSSPISVGVGGSGDAGGDAGTVEINRGDAGNAAGMIFTDGIDAYGIEASSIGGGGGDAGMNFVAGFSEVGKGNTEAGFAAQFAIGGGGGEAGNGAHAEVSNYGDIVTLKDNSHGILAQSIGGGGGNATFNIAVTYADKSGNGGLYNKPNENMGFSLAVGGATGSGGNAGTVYVAHVGNIETYGDNAYGILSQSIGGGGGNAGMDIASTMVSGKQMGITLGRQGGEGGFGADVTLSSNGTVITHGDSSYGLLAQSIGSGGGNSSVTTISGSIPSEQSNKGEVEAQEGKISVGLEGGIGGAAGNVTLDAAGWVITEGDNSHAIFAQSVGGGGGNGGSANLRGKTAAKLSLGLGGTGGEGGIGGDVTVNSSANVATYGENSIGILAQSIGGGGGTGGSSRSQSLNPSKGNAVNIAVGGEGGEGMTAGAINIWNGGAIETDGEGSHGILAQSIGGGGGVAGVTQNSIYRQSDDKESATRVTISLGRSGGEGAEADDVTVVNQGSILTRQDNSVGIFAQSIGGGGGNASKVSTGAVTGKGGGNNYSMSIGGTGGTGSTAGNVSVSNLSDGSDENSGLIVTLGDRSHGIMAMSIGGGGGSGSMSSTSSSKGLKGTDPSATASVANYNLAIGGSGGEGGTAGNVDVINQGTIVTYGQQAHGIVAMSIGGGGGAGGMSKANDTAIKTTAENQDAISLAVGGQGGDGNTSGNVTVTNGGSIEVFGDNSYGIFAQSVGGGGGDGGHAISLSKDLLSNPKTETPGSRISVGIGGLGGDGANSGDVFIEHTGTIVAHGDDSYGIFAQAIGGGGGNAGFALTSPTWIATDLFLKTVLGSSSGSDGIAGDVTINSSGDIFMLGANSQARFTQSVNGGGGNLSYFLDASEQASEFADDTVGSTKSAKVDDSSAKITSVIEMGTTGATNSQGGNVSSKHDGDLLAVGDNSFGSLTQSVGGGGGNLLARMFVDQLAQMNLSLRVGGTSSTGSQGGAIQETRIGDVWSSGFQSQGYVIQSIGGGGGNVILNVSTSESGEPQPVTHTGSRSFPVETVQGLPVIRQEPTGVAQLPNDRPALLAPLDDRANTQLHAEPPVPANLTSDVKSDLAAPTKLAAAEPVQIIEDPAENSVEGELVAEAILGASGGFGNDGGNITSNSIGDIGTEHDQSAGLVVQSIGAGGGQLNLSGPDTLAVTLGGSNGASGNGGDIFLTNFGSIMTLGDLSHGVVIQSIGGGGGAIYTDLDAANIELMLSDVNYGGGGSIMFAQSGDIVVSGDHSIGLIAQSLGGGGGIVDRLFADTAGGNGGSGSIDLLLQGSVIASGSGGVGVFAQSRGSLGQGNIDIQLAEDEFIYGGPGGIGVWISGGDANSLVNHGFIWTEDAVDGWAILGEEGDERIENFGSILGQVDLGSGVNEFINHEEGIFAPGIEVYLGSSGALTNNGTMIIGDAGYAVGSMLTGSYSQSDTGITYAELDFATGVLDNLHATGSVELAGEVVVTLLNPNLIPFGHHRKALFTSDGGLINNGLLLSTAPSVVITYDLMYPDGNSAVLDYNVDFAPEGMSANLTEVGSYFNRIQSVGSSPGLAGTVTKLVYDPTMDIYRESLSQLTPDFYGEHQAEMIRSTQRFAQIIADKAGRSGLNNPTMAGNYRGFNAQQSLLAAAAPTSFLPRDNFEEQPGSVGTGTGYLSATGNNYQFVNDSTALWMQVDFDSNEHHAIGDFKDVDHSLSRLAIGASKNLDNGWSLGFGYARERNTADGFAENWNSVANTNQLGLVLGRRVGMNDFSLVQTYGWSKTEASRVGIVDEQFVARVERDLDAYSGMLRWSRDLSVANPYLTGVLDLGWIELIADGAVESEGGPTSLVLKSNDEFHSYVRPSLRTGYTQKLESGTALHWHASLGWHRYLDDGDTKVLADFLATQGGVDSMRVPIDMGRSYFEGLLGLDFVTSGDISLGIEYSMVFDKTHYDADRWAVNLRAPFK